jgi:glucosamine-6-phosphate isomerase
MQVMVFDNAEDLAKEAAKRIAEVMKEKPNGVIGLATGSSPVATYDQLISMCNAGELSFANAKAYCLDEYVGLPSGHPEAYINFIRRVFTDQVDFQEGTVHAPAGGADDPVLAAAEYDAQIAAAGGIDVQVLGIGSDGHIGFNEPGGSLTSRTHVDHLTEQTRRDNARFFDGVIEDVPTSCITQGLGTIMESRTAVLVAQGEGKAEAVAQMVEGPVSARWPATILQFHPNVVVLLDRDAASKLELSEQYG